MSALDGGRHRGAARGAIEAAWPDPRGLVELIALARARARSPWRTSTSARTSARRSRVGQARGVAMLAAAQRGIPCFDYTPQAVKMAVCGTARRPSSQVQHMVGALLGLPEPPRVRPRRRRTRGRDLPRRAQRASAQALAGGAAAEVGRMIASVRGEVLVRRPDHVVVESRRRRLPAHRLGRDAEGGPGARQGGGAARRTWSSRDDSLALYGFASEEERDLFLHLASVSGVGPKVAIAILSGGAPRELLRAIAAGDAKRFQAAPGVGKRTAERLIVELREKVAGELDEGIPAAGDLKDGLSRDCSPATA